MYIAKDKVGYKLFKYSLLVCNTIFLSFSTCYVDIFQTRYVEYRLMYYTNLLLQDRAWIIPPACDS